MLVVAEHLLRARYPIGRSMLLTPFLEHLLWLDEDLYCQQVL